jgi:CRISPR/Cas system-associated endonuclease Cas1
MTTSTALTVTASTALTATQITPMQRVFVKRARSKSEVIDRIRDASACVADIRWFIADLGHALSKPDLRVVEYALARAYYREGRSLTVRQIALLANQSVKQILNHIKMCGLQLRDAMSNDDASRILCRAVED